MIREVLDVMLSLAKDAMTMVVVSHELGFIRPTRVMVLVDGMVIEEGLPKEIFGNPKHTRTQDFLGKIL